MKLLRCTATFGCLAGESLTFGPGLTLIGAPNGGGKSTWCAFLRTMLYGLDTRQRDRKGVPADKNRYRPWNGAPMEGLLVCEQEGKVLEVRRTSADGVPMGTFSACWQDTGLPVPGVTGENLGEWLTGLSREVFDRSVFLRQTALAVSQSQELEKRIAALVSAGEEEVSWSQADERLKSWLRRRRFHKSGLLPQTEAEADRLRQRLTETRALRQTLDQQQAQAEELRRQQAHWDRRQADQLRQIQAQANDRYAQAAAQLDAAELQVQTLQARCQTLAEEAAEERPTPPRGPAGGASHRRKARRRGLLGLGGTLAILLVWGVSRLLGGEGVPLPAAGALIAALWLALGLVSRRAQTQQEDAAGQAWAEAQAHRQQQRRQAEEDLAQARRQWEQARQYFELVRQPLAPPAPPPEAASCAAALEERERAIAHLQGQLTALGEPAALEAQLEEQEALAAHLRQDCAALELALEALGQADAQLQARFSPRLSQVAGAYFCRLTEGQFVQVSVDRTLQVTVREKDALAERPLALLSQGTADQLYLALRLAVAELVLPPSQDCPLVLDDALLAFDDRRLAVALDLLAELSQRRQVLLFTCQHREQALLRDCPGLTTVALPGF